MKKKTGLLFLAGEKAYRKIKKDGLSPDDVKVCVSASGAAKWIVLYGLDKAVFGNWLNKRQTPVNFFGTSIGAWKFAAACCKNSDKAFDLLVDLYINQRYGKDAGRKEVSETALRIVEELLTDNRIDEILSHPFYRICFSAVRCKVPLQGKSFIYKYLFLLKIALSNFGSRKNLAKYFERTFFMDNRDIPDFSGLNDFKLNNTFLNSQNFKPALIASGSIPLIMDGIQNIPGTLKGEYIDGGIIDYHPVFGFASGDEEIVLYHHFYDYLIPGWFDKSLKWRKAGSRAMENILLVCPSREFVSSLPGEKIPDRNDFKRFKGRDELRISNWNKVKEQSLVLGEEFLEAVETGAIRDFVIKI
ncbi:MAG: hypothetical protein CSA18_02860 [Deltaproteobacteria bacterium]|nr:MAG: hypothetical protein CSA18_02860 [Deltaproteobacteria bacterium]